MMNRLFSLSFFALLSFSACTSAAELDERDVLVASYLEWRGGEAFENATSLVQQGTMEASGLSGTATAVRLRDGRAYFNADLQVVEFTQVLLPEGSWNTNTSGQVEDLGPVIETIARRDLELEFGIPLLAAGANVSLLTDEEKDGTNWGVIRVAYDDGNFHDLLINEDTGALGWVRVHQDTETFWRHYSDWTQVDGVRLPGRSEEFHDVVAENVTLTWVENGVNTPIPDMIFVRPSSERRARIAGDAASTGWIDFDYYRDNRIFLNVTLNGVETFAVLDSGADATVIDAALAQQVGIAGEGSISADGTGGNVEVQIASGVAFSVDSLEMNDLTVALLDLSALSQRLLGRPIPIILGKEVFNEMIVDIDYPNRRIAFHDPAQWSYQGDGTTVALPESEGSRVVGITVEGSEPIIVGFDIGQGSPLTLFEGFVREAGLLDGRPTSDSRGGGVGGEVISTRASVQTMSFGGVQFENVPTTYVFNAVGSFDTELEQGNLGTGIFNRFRMIVNYGDDELYLEPDPATINAEFTRNRAGLQLQITDGAGEIIHIMAGSPAEASELALGDTVVAINGQAIGDDYWTGDLWRWTDGRPGSSVVLELDDGREVELTLADFY